VKNKKKNKISKKTWIIVGAVITTIALITTVLILTSGDDGDCSNCDATPEYDQL